ncbi:hypothetical protein Q8A73_021799 [Channa argus]|nr:hypothetical protein Q8A73_021799 [Channa argus]
MPGFVAVLAAFAVLSAGLSSVAVEEGSIAGVKSSAVPALNHSAVAHVGTSADGDKRTGQAGCPGRCRCEVDGLLHRVDCSDLGLLEIPSNLSIFTSYLSEASSESSNSSMKTVVGLRVPGSTLVGSLDALEIRQTFWRKTQLSLRIPGFLMRSHGS